MTFARRESCDGLYQALRDDLSKLWGFVCFLFLWTRALVELVGLLGSDRYCTLGFRSFARSLRGATRHLIAVNSLNALMEVITCRSCNLDIVEARIPIPYAETKYEVVAPYGSKRATTFLIECINIAYLRISTQQHVGQSQCSYKCRSGLHCDVRDLGSWYTCSDPSLTQSRALWGEMPLFPTTQSHR